jgi:hypothetical protein
MQAQNIYVDFFFFGSYTLLPVYTSIGCLSVDAARNDAATASADQQHGSSNSVDHDMDHVHQGDEHDESVDDVDRTSFVEGELDHQTQVRIVLLHRQRVSNCSVVCRVCGWSIE